jgi:catechol 2,3-dioxygenase-like lactoylglutathione lyase family enzyme
VATEDDGKRGCWVEGLAHILLQVTDLEEAERFYCGLLGFKVRSRSTFEEDRPLITTHQGLGITLLPSLLNSASATVRPNLEHVAVWVVGVHDLANTLRRNGFEATGPLPTPYGMSLRVRDPDGNRVELIERG